METVEQIKTVIVVAGKKISANEKRNVLKMLKAQGKTVRNAGKAVSFGSKRSAKMYTVEYSGKNVYRVSIAPLSKFVSVQSDINAIQITVLVS